MRGLGGLVLRVIINLICSLFSIMIEFEKAVFFYKLPVELLQ
jgi:hypothetical protein